MRGKLVLTKARQLCTKVALQCQRNIVDREEDKRDARQQYEMLNMHRAELSC